MRKTGDDGNATPIKMSHFTFELLTAFYNDLKIVQDGGSHETERLNVTEFLIFFDL